MLDVICFSHRRQLQLHGYLESLFYYCDPHRVIVIYPNQDYSGVISAFPNVEFVKEDPDFNETLKRIVYGVNSRAMMFGCDDMTFTSPVPLSSALWTLANYRILGYSIRLHDKISDVSSRIWDWTRKTQNVHCCYPFDLTGTIYRTECIKNLLANIRPVKGPNTFESLGVGFMKACLSNHYPLLSRGEFPSCIIQQVNKVQTEILPVTFKGITEQRPDYLDSLYKEGRRLDWKSAADVATDDVWSNDLWRIC